MPIKVETLVLGPVGANTYIVTDEQSGLSAVIDAGDFNSALKSALVGKKVKYILLTHGHFDHILGVHALKEFTDAEVVIHPADLDCLKDANKSLALSAGGFSQIPVEADILVSQGDVLSLGDTEIKVMHTPGHTKGGVCYIIEKDRVIFTGDTLFALTVGRTDFEGGSDEEMLDSVTRLSRLEGDYIIYPGHNRSTTLENERRRNRYMSRRIN